MVKKQISFFLFYFFTISMFCQVGKAVYGKQLKSYESDTPDNASQYAKKIVENLKTQEFQLTFNNQKATYKKIKFLNNNTSPVLKAMTEGIIDFRGAIYYDKASDIILHEKEFAGVNYLIKRNKIDWILTKDTLKIDNYLCYKATTTYTIENTKGKHTLEVVVWYAPEIPIPYGPDGYGGLPGLILQLDNNGILTSLKKIEFFKKDNKIDIELPTKGKKVSEEEFNSIVSKQYTNRKN
ncbi:GLPGLI family protein [Winogradskyella pacifica]|uniref:GLPGLI family protein n=1 Tax=Winogradskyella pacifica TaxID=664642 RepID=UPI0015C7E501|nr:GLPGLI family protein [Winogradskyella pacifica]